MLVGTLNCLPTEVFAHWFLLYIVGVTSSTHQRDPTEISLALSVGEPLHEQSFPTTVFNSFIISFYLSTTLHEKKLLYPATNTRSAFYKAKHPL